MISSANCETFSTAPSSAATPYSASTAESLLSPSGDELLDSSDRGAVRDLRFLLSDFEPMTLGDSETVGTRLGPRVRVPGQVDTKWLTKDMRRHPDFRLRWEWIWPPAVVFRILVAFVFPVGQSLAIGGRLPEES